MKLLVCFVIISVATAAFGHSLRNKADAQEHGKAHGRKHGKWNMDKKGLFNLQCLAPATSNATMTAMFNSMKNCSAQMMNSTGVTITDDASKREWFKTNGFCVKSCIWQKEGILTLSSDGTTGTFNESAIAESSKVLIPKAQEGFATEIANCQAKKKLAMTVTLGENCIGLKPYLECWMNGWKAACPHDKPKGGKATTGSPNPHSDESDAEDFMDSEEAAASTTAASL